ncbi:Fur family transcriptional regulator [Rudaeicoccus suwonensis]|uniref:Fur family ferric uptake transcriptional regulator n=1 Tax=Rudaeicoccus suwonensis TaxID=657409 RepID=A0A561E442_9MICO|nr:Fur family transcriptional regulator [Rudaeicoccus suwonensis]TWE10379.1 Fur family ferric uptake transcriptional regulator [Rudaeicoccus suwonensis]
MTTSTEAATPFNGSPRFRSHPRFEDTLRRAGLRVTRPRTQVLIAVEELPHADGGRIHERVRAVLPSVSRQAVYDCLNTFAETGIVRRIEPAGSSARYELRTGDNHHHLVCRTCGVVVDVDCAVGEAPCLTAAESHGFAIDEAEVIYWGLCPDCTT